MIETSRALFLSLAICLVVSGQSNTPVPLNNVYIPGITTTTILDNRSAVSRQLKYSSIACTGTGSWSAALQYGASPYGPWTSVPGTALVDNSSAVPVAYGFLYTFPSYYRVLIVSGSPTCAFSGFQNLFVASGSGNVFSVFGRVGSVTATSGDYNASQVTNAVDSTSSYSNPSWITSIAAVKITGVLSPSNGGTGRSAFSRSGNTDEYASVSGVKTSGKQLAFDASGNVIASSADIGGGGGAVSSVSAGPSGALVSSPNTGSVVVDFDPSFINNSSWDFRGVITSVNASATAPAKAGTTLPASCVVADQFFDTDAAAGSNLFGCTSPNTWTALGGSGSYPPNTVAPTYLWQNLCRTSSSGWFSGFQNINGDLQHSTVTTDPACSVQYTISGSGDQGLIYMGDGGDKVVRNNGNWDVTFDAAVTTQNDKTVFFGILQGTTRTNDGCYIRGQRVDSSTVYALICRSGGVDGTPVSMTGNTITASRSRFRIRRVSGTVFASIDGGTEFSTTSSVPTAAQGSSPVIRWENAIGGASGTMYFYRFGMAY